MEKIKFVFMIFAITIAIIVVNVSDVYCQKYNIGVIERKDGKLKNGKVFSITTKDYTLTGNVINIDGKTAVDGTLDFQTGYDSWHKEGFFFFEKNKKNCFISDYNVQKYNDAHIVAERKDDNLFNLTDSWTQFAGTAYIAETDTFGKISFVHYTGKCDGNNKFYISEINLIDGIFKVKISRPINYDYYGKQLMCTSAEFNIKLSKSEYYDFDLWNPSKYINKITDIVLCSKYDTRRCTIKIADLADSNAYFNNFDEFLAYLTNTKRQIFYENGDVDDFVAGITQFKDGTSKPVRWKNAYYAKVKVPDFLFYPSEIKLYLDGAEKIWLTCDSIYNEAEKSLKSGDCVAAKQLVQRGKGLDKYEYHDWNNLQKQIDVEIAKKCADIYEIATSSELKNDYHGALQMYKRGKKLDPDFRKWDNDIQNVERKLAIISKYGTAKGIKIVNGEIELGMTTEMVKDALNNYFGLYEISRTNDSRGKIEVWRLRKANMLEEIKANPWILGLPADLLAFAWLSCDAIYDKTKNKFLKFKNNLLIEKKDNIDLFDSMFD